MSFIGMSIVGDVNRSSTSRVPQRTAEEFAEIIQAALAADGVAEVSWKQYTPYFNDGEPCVFSCYGLGKVRLTSDPVRDEWDDDEWDEWGYGQEFREKFGDRDEWGYGQEFREKFGDRPVSWDHSTSPATRVLGPYAGPNEPRYDALDALNTALSSGAFENVLLNLFGDHAEVRVVAGDAIHVEYYEHD